MSVADHERDGHGLAERAAEAEHDAADHPDAGVGTTTCQMTSQVVAPRAVAGLLEHIGHGLKDIAHHRRNERQHHDREHQAGGQHPDAERRPLEKPPDQGSGPSVLDEPGLYWRCRIGARTNSPQMPKMMLGTAASSSIATPTGRLSRLGTARSGRWRCRSRTGPRCSMRDERGDQRAVHGGERPELLGHRVPDFAGQESRA